jgi:hypothetical protein
MDLSGVTRPVVVPRRTDPTGAAGPTRAATRTKQWRCTSHGFYVPADVDGSALDQRIVEAAVVLPRGPSGVTGWAALAWRGGKWFDGTPWGGGPARPIVLAVGGNRSIRNQPGRFATSEERLAEADVVLVDGLPVTTAVRSVCFEMRYAASDRDAATSLSMACFNDLVSLAELDAYLPSLAGWCGAPRARAGRSLAAENLWSPQEAVMSYLWVLDAGLGPVLGNQPVFDLDGAHIGTPDLLDGQAGVAGDYNGRPHHIADDRRHHDLNREAKFRGAGLEYVTMVAGDHRDPDAFVRRLRQTYDRAGDIPPHRKRWTIEPPSWWRDTTTVAARRALDGYWRERLLRHRVA